MTAAVRRLVEADTGAVRRLVLAAFQGNAPAKTAAFLDALRAERCLLGEWVAEQDRAVVGHVAFSRVGIALPGEGQVDAAMLTPLSVLPARQRQGIGRMLSETALAQLQAAGETLFLVLGHPAYYPRLGFSAARAAGIAHPWGDTPAFMARGVVPAAGRLVLPAAIAAAP